MLFNETNSIFTQNKGSFTYDARMQQGRGWKKFAFYRRNFKILPSDFLERDRENALFPSPKPLSQSGLQLKGFGEWYTGLGAQKMIPEIFNESKKYKSIILLKIYFLASDAFQQLLKRSKRFKTSPLHIKNNASSTT